MLFLAIFKTEYLVSGFIEHNKRRPSILSPELNVIFLLDLICCSWPQSSFQRRLRISYYNFEFLSNFCCFLCLCFIFLSCYVSSGYQYFRIFNIAGHECNQLYLPLKHVDLMSDVKQIIKYTILCSEK